VLERVRDVLLGDLDVETDAAFRELFDLRLHESHCVRRPQPDRAAGGSRGAKPGSATA
jgi:hypothetical protein